MKQLNRIIGALAALLGVYLLITGTKLQLFLGKTPGPGFLPFGCGILLILLGALIAFMTFGAKADNRPNPMVKAEFYNLAIISGGTIGVMLLTPLLGIVIPLGLMSGALAWLMGERRVKTLISLTVLSPIVFHVVFAMILGVNLPLGIFKM